MTARSLVAALGLGLALAGCGGESAAEKKERLRLEKNAQIDAETDLLASQAEASSIASKLGMDCVSDSLGSDTFTDAEFAEHVNKLIDLWKKTEHDAEIGSTMRDVAGSLGTCGQDAQADRLYSAVDNAE